MNFRNAIALIVFCLSISSVFAQSGEDWEAGRLAAARLVAESIVTDKAYEALINVYVSSGEIADYAGDAAMEKAAKINEKEAFEGVMAAARSTVPKNLMVTVLATAVAKTFTFDELKDVLRFIRSNVGKKYLAIGYDETFLKTFQDALGEDGLLPDPRPALVKELSSRFPNIKFNF